jgi:hypothetical protein
MCHKVAPEDYGISDAVLNGGFGATADSVRGRVVRNA